MSVTVVASGGNVSVATSSNSVSIATTTGTNIATWDRLVALAGRGYNYPQPTGQTTVYRTGDDADIEATIFAPIRAANSLKAQNSLADFTTLNNTNSFGNTNRFTDVNGLQIYGDNYIIDNYTGLGWYALKIDITGLTLWDELIDLGVSSNQNSFDDWFIPNITQAYSLNNDNSVLSVFNNAAFFYFSTSTTRSQSTTQAIRPTSTNFIGGFMNKTQIFESLLCRKHF